MRVICNSHNQRDSRSGFKTSSENADSNGTYFPVVILHEESRSHNSANERLVSACKLSKAVHTSKEVLSRPIGEHGVLCSP